MTQQRCSQPIPFADLVDYLQGELESPKEISVEEHFFACHVCTHRMESVVRVGAAVASAVRSGGVVVSVSNALLTRAEQEGLKLRQYRLEPGGSVACTAAPDDDIVVVRLAADLEDTTEASVEIDTRFLTSESRQHKRVHDVAVDRTQNEIVLLFPGEMVRSFPRSQWTMQVIATDSSGERSFGPYVMNHTPWGELSSPV